MNNAIKFSHAAQTNIEETGADVAADLSALADGSHTRESLLAHCLDGADADREQGWREYVDALVEALESARALGAANGREAVEAFVSEDGIEALAATLAPGHLGWDEPAAAAGAARTQGVPDGLHVAYYEAYEAAARELATTLIAEGQ